MRSSAALSRRRRAATVATVLTTVLAGLALVAGPAAGSTACAGKTTATWTGAGDGQTWSSPANWEGAAVPAAGDNVTITSPASIDLDVIGNGGTVELCDVLVQPGAADADAVAIEAAPGGATTLKLTGAMTVNDTTTLTGVGVDLPANAVIEVNGATLRLAGLPVPPAPVEAPAPAVSRWADGARIQGPASGTSGAVEVDARAGVQLGGTMQVAGNAVLRTKAQSTLTTTGGGAVLQGMTPGASFAWDAGTVDGVLTLDIPATTASTGTRSLADSSTMTVAPARDLVVSGGTVTLDGTLHNKGVLRLVPGTVVTSSGSATGTVPSLIRNESGDPNVPAVIAIGVADNAPPGAGATVVPVQNVAVRSTGLIRVVSGTRMVLSGNLPQPVVSELTTEAKIRDGYTHTGTTAPPPNGIVQVAGGATLRLPATSLLENKAVLLLDDGQDGTKARIVTANGSPAKLTSTSASVGTFRWRSGTVTGPLTVDKVQTDIATNVDASSRVLNPGTNVSLPALTLAGPAAVNRSLVTLAPQATVVVATPLDSNGNPQVVVAGGPSGFRRSGAALEGQQVTILGNSGMRTSAAYKTDTSQGSTTAPARFDVPLVNRGRLFLRSNLNLLAGYRQEAQAGAPSPLTGLLSPDSQTTGTVTLSAGEAASGGWSEAFIDAGRLAGAGTVSANPLKVGNAQIDPGYVDTTTQAAIPGKLTVRGDLRLSAGSDVQIAINGAGADQHDILEVVRLTYKDGQNADVEVAPGTAYLNGRITGFSATAFRPAYLSKVENVVTYPSRVGQFATWAWAGTASGLGYKPQYDDAATPRSTDLQLVDVMAPTLRLAGIPAFTQFTQQRVSWSATDNKAGVLNYDVRWMVAAPNRQFTAWRYPAGWQGTTATAVTKTRLAAGSTYCFAIRARDRAGNTTPWSQRLCTSRMYDDRAMLASSGWLRPGGQSGWYGGTYSRAMRRGAELTKTGTFSRVGVTAYRCPTCGILDIYAGRSLLKRWDLRSSRIGTASWVSPPMRVGTRTLKLRAVTRPRRLVVVDAVGMSR